VFIKHIPAFKPLSNPYRYGGANVKVCGEKIAFSTDFFTCNPEGLTFTFAEAYNRFASSG
jgi:hypothetical protein